MSLTTLILRSLRFHWRTHLAVALGVAVGTAVLTGALLVGDSMRESLRGLALDRLGRIDHALVTERFFRAGLADELAATPEFERESRVAAPAILLRASLEKADAEPPVRANGVNLLGCDERFWQLGDGRWSREPGRQEIVLNEPLAKQLGVGVGDEVLVRLPRPSGIPAESPLGAKRETVRGQRLTVSDIIPAEGLGQFGLRPTQHAARNAYVSLASLQAELGEQGRANAIFTARPTLPMSPQQELRWPCAPKLDDYGIEVQAEGKRSGHTYFNITSERMLFDPAAERAILAALARDPPLPPGEGRGEGDLQVQPVLIYLANTIACGDRQMPYSTVAAIDFEAQPPLGPLVSPTGKPVPPLVDGEIALNSWAAEDLQTRVGDSIRLTYFEPESTHGQVREKTVPLRLAAIVELTGAAADPALTPTVRGITDKVSMADWDPPFPFDARRVRKKDEDYWNEHKATPKAFVSLATGRRLWASRFGQTTSIRVAPAPGMTLENLQRRLAVDPAAMGFVFQPVRQQALAASQGTTPFNALFLGFSSFIIAAAVMLVALLFRLGVERRAKEGGMLLAVGFRRRQWTRLLVGEGLAVAAAGSLLGVAAGVGYAALMLLGLRTWWLAAVATPLLRLHATAGSLIIGYTSGLAIAVATIAWTARQFGRIAPRRLLAQSTHHAPRDATSGQIATLHSSLVDLAMLLAAVAPAVVLLAAPLGEDAQAGAFFGAGALALTCLLLVVRRRLRRGATGPAVAAGRGNLARMALRNAARNPGRSTLSIGLVASACFLITSVSAFRLDPARLASSREGGAGGLSLYAESDQPIYQDMGTKEGRAQLGFSTEDERLLAECQVVALRVKPGDDASCLNLYQPRQPRLLGVPERLIARGGFAWAAAPKDETNPWRELEGEGGGPESNAEIPHPDPLPEGEGDARPVPAILDKNTANYSLHLWGGRGETYAVTDSSGRTLDLQVAALLSNSIFQGDLLVSERALLAYDPSVSGYRVFLLQTPAGKEAAVRAALERTLGDYGLGVQSTAERLADFSAVQNTYLSTFQSLGGLGLLLGTVGLAAVQLRNVWERRAELALLRAAGFRRRMLARLVLLENALLLGAGLAVGALAGLAAVLPHLVRRDAAVPWLSLGGMFVLVLAAGLLAGLAAVRAAVRAPLMAALREE